MFSYDGGIVTRKKLEEAIDLFVEVETDYKESVRKSMLEGKQQPLFADIEGKYPDINAAYEAVKQFAKQIQPNDLSSMQRVFYGIVNSEDDPFRRTVISDYLTIEWDGIGDWRK
ncbi:MAG: hypothetical protein M0Z57_07185 [Deltaproteobacteria bacterium]|jgi:hypothetical protein|nr:hypothetical protein [Deltaproteobacteria bacterium]